MQCNTMLLYPNIHGYSSFQWLLIPYSSITAFLLSCTKHARQHNFTVCVVLAALVIGNQSLWEGGGEGEGGGGGGALSSTNHIYTKYDWSNP